jgi:Cu(I)/Ag(I) efflux system membrane fusion protein
MKYLVFVCVAFVLFACGENMEGAEQQAAPVAASSRSNLSETFNMPFKASLNAYYALKDAFIAENIQQVDTAAALFSKTIAAIPFSEIGSDSVRSAAGILAESMQAELIGLKGETLLEEKRKAFQLLTEQMTALIHKVQYDREVIYYQYCPMAMDNNGAAWLSASSEIQNPYLPTTMLECGEVKDTLNVVRD